MKLQLQFTSAKLRSVRKVSLADVVVYYCMLIALFCHPIDSIRLHFLSGIGESAEMRA